jgi:tetratricopeptide (TPR) repeat protein
MDTLINNRYQMDTLLGRGGMGAIYRAHDTFLERDVAVKVLDETGLGTEGRARLLNEARAAAQLNHPNIVSVYDAGEQDGAPYIVMELVDGKSLYELRPQKVAEILAIAKQICAALEHAHCAGIVHRDLKPENVLIQPNGVAKLTDFGLARSLSARLTNEGMITGTVFYIAPELALGQPFDGRADLYALGVMLYELIAGRPPFTADDPLAVISQHIHAPVVPPSAYRPDLSPAIETVILKLLAKAPEDRYPTAQATLQALSDAELGVFPAEQLGPRALSDVLLEKLARGRMVGRRDELETLHHLWKTTLTGQAHMALISGEPGIGKTRLANETLVYARLNGAVVMRGGCYEYEAATPYLPFVEAFREWVHEKSPEELKERLGASAVELAKLAPEIESRLGTLSQNPSLSPNEERLRLFDHVARFFHNLSENSGLLLFIDDIHWADQGTLSLLHYLLRHLRNERLMVLACYREVELDRQHPFAASLMEWNRDHLAVRISLNRLTVEQVGQLLSSLFEQEAVSEDFRQAIYQDTEGNPFFIEEVIKSLIEQGQIYRVEGHWERKEISELAIPQSVKEAIGRRLDRQSEICLDMLHSAAALGKRFSFSELVATSSIGEDELLDALDEASHAQLIRLEGGEVYLFTHDKIREVLYEELNPIRKRRLHLRIGEGLEKLYGLNACEPGCTDARLCHCDVQALAHHFIEAGELEKGLRYAVQAAEKAEQVFALPEAVEYYQRAIECAEALDRQDELLRLYEALGWVHYNHGAFQLSIEAFDHMLQLADTPQQGARAKSNLALIYAQTGDERGRELLEAAIQSLDPQIDQLELARVNSRLGRFHHLHADWSKAIEYLERARQLAEPLDDVGVLTEIYAYLSGAYQQWGKWEQSIHWAHRTVALGKRTGSLLAEALGYEFLAEDLMNISRWQEALDYAERDRQIGEKIGSLPRIAWAYSAFAHVYNGIGELEKALEAVEACLKIVEQTGEERLAALVRAVRANTYVDMGDFEAAWKDVTYVQERASATGHEQVWGWSFGCRMYLLASEGRWEEVLKVSQECFERLGYRYPYTEALAYISLDHRQDLERLIQASALDGDAGMRESQPWVYLIQARVQMYLGNRSAAEGYFEQAIAEFERRSGKIGVAMSHYWRALFRQADGQARLAQEDSRRAAEIFQVCGAKRYALGAQALTTTLENVVK